MKSVFDICFEYAKTGIDFLLVENDIYRYSPLLDVFDYAMRKVLGLPSEEKSMSVWAIGDRLASRLVESVGYEIIISAVKYDVRTKMLVITMGYFKSMLLLLMEEETKGYEYSGGKAVSAKV